MPRNFRGLSGYHPPSFPFVKNEKSPQARGLVGWWPMSNSAGQKILVDMSGRGNHGTFPATAPDWAVSSQFGWHLDFVRANDDYVILYSGGELVAQNDITVLVWLQIGFNNKDMVFFSQFDVATGQYSHQFRVEDSPPTLSYDNYLPSGGLIAANTSLSVDTWYNGGFTRLGNAVTFYLNGVPDGTGTGDERGSAAVVDETRMGSNASAKELEGKLFDMRVYDRALSAQEVWHTYNPQTRWDLYQPVKRIWPVVVAAPAAGNPYYAYAQQ